MDKQEIVKNLTAEELKAMNSVLAEELHAEGRAVGMASAIEAAEKTVSDDYHAAGYAKGLAEGKVAGAEAERERIKSVEAQALPGHTELIEQLKYDGKTTGPEAAVKILKVEKEARTIHRDKLKADALTPVQQTIVSATETAGNPDGTARADKEKERDKLIAAYQAAHACDYRTAAFAVSKAHPELFKDR